MSYNLTTLHITKKNVFVLEGSVDGEVCNIKRTVVIPDMERFFDQTNGQLYNLEGMVESIVITLRRENIANKCLNICYDNVLLETDHDINQISLMKTKKSGDIELFKKPKKDEKIVNKKIFQPEVKHEHMWGKFITRDSRGELVTTAVVERDLIDYMVSAFEEYGYRVNSIEPVDTAIIYLRKFVPYKYDAMHKIILHANNEEGGTIYIFTKDCPSLIKPFRFEDYDGRDIAEKIVNICNNEIIIGKMRNPYLFVTGEMFAKNKVNFEDVRDGIENTMAQLIDIYGVNSKPIIDEMMYTMLPKSGLQYNFDGRFAICLSLMLRVFDPSPENLCEARKSSVNIKSLSSLSKALKIISVLLLAGGIIFGGWNFYNSIQIENELKEIEDKSSELNAIENEKSNLQITLDATNTIDSRYDELLKFVMEHNNSSINIVSIDTEDILPVSGQSSTIYGETGTEETAEQPVDSSGYSKYSITMRGYSLRSDTPTEYYNLLVEAGIGDVQPIQLKQSKISSTEYIYVFEIVIK